MLGNCINMLWDDSNITLVMPIKSIDSTICFMSTKADKYHESPAIQAGSFVTFSRQGFLNLYFSLKMNNRTYNISFNYLFSSCCIVGKTDLLRIHIYFLDCSKKLLLVYFLTVLLITRLGLFSWSLYIANIRKYIKIILYCSLKVQFVNFK